MKKPPSSSGKVSSHPGFNAMVHHGGKHPGAKAAMRKEAEAPMPQPEGGNTPMSGMMGGPAQGGMPPGSGEGC